MPMAIDLSIRFIYGFAIGLTATIIYREIIHN